MSDFLDLIESINMDAADSDRVFNSRTDGVAVRAGQNRLRRRYGDETYNRMLAEGGTLVASAIRGSRRAMVTLEEAMTTSDFPIILGDLIDRSVMARWSATQPVWRQFATPGTRTSFRAGKVRYVKNGLAPLERVGERSPYPERSISEGEATRQVYKYGARQGFSFEAMVNDDLELLRDTPAQFVTACERTESLLVTQAYVDANGPHASVFTSGNANIINTTNGASATNPALNINGLADGISVMAKAVDEDGYPIIIEQIVLVVPPALKVTALNLINATEVWGTAAMLAGASNAEMHVRNWMTTGIEVVVDPFIPIVCTDATKKNTSWFLMAKPGTTRPGIRLDYLAGHESPQILMKSPNAVSVGGSEVGAMSGDFDTDSIDYRVRHILGASVTEPRAMLASNGSGS